MNATSGRADLQEQATLLEQRSEELKLITAEVVAFEEEKRSLEERTARIQE